MCGEKVDDARWLNDHAGTSPRVWGKDTVGQTAAIRLRNIPTCVGKRSLELPMVRVRPEHPHVCGEKSIDFAASSALCGTSPRVWGKVLFVVFHYVAIRNIPTCVGKRARRLHARSRRPEHPHVCGEKLSSNGGRDFGSGTSPRVWGKEPKLQPCRQRMRNIPTCVGKRCSKSRNSGLGNGTSPRVWGKDVDKQLGIIRKRNIPTCVGKRPN